MDGKRGSIYVRDTVNLLSKILDKYEKSDTVKQETIENKIEGIFAELFTFMDKITEI